MEIPRGWDDAFARIFAASHSRGRFAWPQNAWPTASSPSRPQNCRRNTENACPGIRETIPEITETFAAARPTVFDPKPSAISPPRWYFSRFPSNVHASLAVSGFEFPPPEDFETRRSPNFFNSSRDSSRERERRFWYEKCGTNPSHQVFNEPPRLFIHGRNDRVTRSIDRYMSKRINDSSSNRDVAAELYVASFEQTRFLPSERIQFATRRFVGWNDRWMELFEARLKRAHAWQQAPSKRGWLKHVAPTYAIHLVVVGRERKESSFKLRV